jgi:hypothetical protein
MAMSQPTGPGSGPLPEPDAAGYGQLPPLARALVLVAAALAMVIYLLGFVGEVSVTSSFGGPLLVGGGLLAGVAVLPRVGRVLAPAAVLTGTGALFLLQLAIGIGWPPVVLVATVLALAEAAAVVGALLLDNGLAAGRPAPYPPGAGLGAPGHLPFEHGLTGSGQTGRYPPAIGAAPATRAEEAGPGESDLFGSSSATSAEPPSAFGPPPPPGPGRADNRGRHRSVEPGPSDERYQPP